MGNLKLCIKLKISNLLLETETDILSRFKILFTNKWVNLVAEKKLLFLSLGFSSDSFDIVQFPNKKWDSFTKNQRITALKFPFSA